MTRYGWQERALTELSELAHVQLYLTSDDVHEIAGDPPIPNMMGDAIRCAISLRILIPTGTYVQSSRPSAKGRTIKLYRSGFLVPPADSDPVATYQSTRPTHQGALAI